MWSPKLTRSATSLSDRGTSSTDSIVPTRTSILSSVALSIVGLTGAGVMGRRLRCQALLGFAILPHEARDEIRGGKNVIDQADALAATPDIAPRLALLVAARSKIH